MPEKYNYTVGSEESVNIWKLDDIRQEFFQSEPATFDPYKTFDPEGKLVLLTAEMKHKIVLPPRKEFLEQNLISNAKHTDREFHNLYFPWASNSVDLSTFCFEPEVISLYGRVYLTSDTSKSIEFEVKTCSAVKIWVNGEVQVLYTPYDRNIPMTSSITLNVDEGENEILIYTDDLGERNTSFYFELINKSGEELNFFVPISNSLGEVEQAKRIIESVYLVKDKHIAEEIVLKYDNSLIEEDFDIFCGEEEIKVTLTKGADSNVIGNSGDENDEFFYRTSGVYFPVKAKIGEYEIGTNLFLVTYSGELTHIEPAATVEERKKQINRILSDSATGALDNDNCSTLLSILDAEGQLTPLAREILEGNLETIEKRYDCSDFRLPVILVAVKKYGHLIPDDLHKRIKEVALNFRYWCDEPGNDVMWFFSENHTLLFHVSQYLAASLYPDEVFKTSGKTSDEQRQTGHDRIIRWFDDFLARGYDEWNSVSYFPVDFVAFFTLYHMAPDRDILDYAKKCIDMTFEIIASNLHNNIYTSSYGRTYETMLKGIDLGELSVYSWMMWGRGSLNVLNLATGLIATSDYVTPDFSSLYELGDKTITVERLQGYDEIYTYVHKCREYSLASAMNALTLKKGQQQHVINLSFSEEELSIWINHPGEMVYSGNRRPSYWAGSQRLPYVEQYKNTLMAGFKIEEEDDVHYIHAYVPFLDFVEWEILGNWLTFKKGDAYGAIFFANGMDVTAFGANRNKEVISRGLENGVIIKCGSKREFGSFEDFKTLIGDSFVSFNSPVSMVYDDCQYGKFVADQEKGLSLKGKLVDREATLEAKVSIDKIKEV